MALSIVEDLIPLILEATDHWWTQDYLRLACVSRSWLLCIRKRLYTRPSLYSFNATNALARTLQKNPALLQLVAGIDLQPMCTGGRRSVLSEQDIESVRYLLGLDGLKRVKLGGQFARKAERFLNTLACPDQVEELVVDGGLLRDAIGSPASLEWDESMFYRFPSLRTLKLANLALDIIPPSGPCRTPINHLFLDNVAISGGFLCQAINGAFLDLLSIWAGSASEYDEQVRLVLENCDVRTLHYEVCTSQRADRSFLDLERTGSLPIRRLQLEEHVVDDGLLAEIIQHCHELEELVVGGRASLVSAGGWQDLIASRALPCLTAVGLPRGSHFAKWSPVDLLAIESTAAFYNIQLLN